MKFISIVTALMIFGIPSSRAAGGDRSIVRNCQQTGNPALGIGQPYKGAIHNEDYDFSASLPSGLTGWTGVDDSAPSMASRSFSTRSNKAVSFLKYIFE